MSLDINNFEILIGHYRVQINISKSFISKTFRLLYIHKYYYKLYIITKKLKKFSKMY